LAVGFSDKPAKSMDRLKLIPEVTLNGMNLKGVF
jgi:hypothetical protein